MDYYQLLRITPSASKKDIDEAYHRLVKESNYDSSIDRIMVDTAYRILSNPKQKAAYDSIKDKREKGIAAYAATMSRRKEEKWTAQKLVKLAAVLLVIAVIYYAFRFGHSFKSFDVGDTVYLSETHQKMGTIVQIEAEHNFGNMKEPAYLIRGPQGTNWFPEVEVKQRCYKQN